MSHYGSSGQPYSEGNPGGLPFSPSGDTKKVKKMSGASTEGTEPDEGDLALGELGAGIRKKTKSSSLSKDGERVPVSLESEGLAKSPYNR